MGKYEQHVLSECYESNGRAKLGALILYTGLYKTGGTLKDLQTNWEQLEDLKENQRTQEES